VENTDLTVVANSYLIAVVNEKGGSTKTTNSINSIPAVVKNIVQVIESDADNDTGQLYEKTKNLEGKLVWTHPRNLKDALIRGLYNSGVVVVNGHPDDIFPAIESTYESSEVLIIIPFLSARAQVQNVLSTIKKIKGRWKILLVGSSGRKEDFIFWFGSEHYGIDGVDKKLKQLPFVTIPHTNLFDLTSVYGQTIVDFAEHARKITPIEMRRYAHEKSNGNIEIFTKLMAHYHIARDCVEFIDNDLADLRNAIEIMMEIK
jgi:hypothetical protein